MSRRHLKNCRLAIFDWNGTLVDDLWLAVKNVYYTFRHFKIQMPPDLEARYREEITGNFKKFYHQHGIPSRVTAEEMNAARRSFFGKFGHLSALRDNAEKTLTICRGLGNLKIAIVSAEDGIIIRKKLKKLNLAGYFDSIWPDSWNKKAALIHACRHFQVKPAQAFYVDDTTEGILASHDCGIVPVSLITSTSYTPEAILRKTARKHGGIVIADLFDITKLI